ncbi:MAG TPA: hypothetical protein PK514_04710 [Spirochaetota bacterium]|nr:hypothetical protein [Spirochaetota bacterium]
MKIKKYIILLFAAAAMFLSCSAGMFLYASDDEDDAVRTCKSVDQKKYGSYLIDVNLYTGGGDSLHKKYMNELLCLASVMIEQQDIPLVKQTVGFYRDSLGGSRSPFYIGFDVAAEYDGSLDYGRFCTRLIRENAGGIAEEAARLESVFGEQDVAGVVVTFRWTWNSQDGNVTIWMKEGDIRLFNNDKITASELYQRSTITNTRGKVILLPI